MIVVVKLHKICEDCKIGCDENGSCPDVERALEEDKEKQYKGARIFGEVRHLSFGDWSMPVIESEAVGTPIIVSSDVHFDNNFYEIWNDLEMKRQMDETLRSMYHR